MSCSPAFKRLIGLLLPLTLGWKLAAGPDDPSEIPHAIVQFLTHRAFENVKIDEVMAGMWAVSARIGECRVFVVEVSSNGWTKELIRTFAEPSDRLFVVLQGSVYDYDSTWRTAANNIYVKVLRKLGLRRAMPSVGVAASPNCAAEQLPWNEL